MTEGRGKVAHIQVQRIIKAPSFKVYQYLTAPENLKEQLDGLVSVDLLNPGIEPKIGSEYLFQMERFGVDYPIRFVIEKYVTGHSFTYNQVKGLLASWRHTMRFEEKDANSTLVTDLVEYEVPFGIVGRLVDDFFARREMRKILEYRLDKADARLSGDVLTVDTTQNA